MDQMRVLQGVTGQAGQPHALAQGLRSIGIHAETCSITQHKFGYQFDRFCDLAGATSLEQVYQRVKHLIDDFDLFHFHARSFLAEWPNLAYPAALDLLLLKLRGKKVYFHYRGQEIRLASVFAEKNPFHYVNEPSGYLFEKMPDASKLRMRDFIFAICDGVFANDPEIQSYAPGSVVIPRALESGGWPFVGISDRSRPIVVHAPSRRGVKGTDAVVRAASELIGEGLDFELRLVENLSHSEAVGIYREADIIIDQLRIGWYGVLTVEAMALGKPVIVYIRDDLWKVREKSLPIINANPENIKSQLRNLLLSVDTRRRLSFASREYFLNTHAADKVAELLASEYRKDGSKVDLAAVSGLLDHQTAYNRSISKRRPENTVTKQNSLFSSRVDHVLRLWHADGARAAIAAISQFLQKKVRR